MKLENLVMFLVTARAFEGSVIFEGTDLQEKRELRAEICEAVTKICNLKDKKEIMKEAKIIEAYFKQPPKNFKHGGDWCEIKGGLESYCMSNHCFVCPANTLGPYYNPNSKLIQKYKEGKIESRLDSMKNSLDELQSHLEELKNDNN